MNHKIFLRILAVLAVSIASESAFAQIEKSLKFIPEEVNFGNIRETDGAVTKIVRAVNISQDSTFIISARTSCGCSEAQFDGRMLAPGDTTTVKITYDPTNRPGKFLKMAKIFTGKERISNTFRLKGNVIPSRRHLDKVYPDKAGSLRLSSLFAIAGELRHTESKPIFIGIYNDSDKPMKIAVETDNPALEADIRPDSIEPFGITTLSMMVRGKDIGKDVSDFKFNATVSDAATGEAIVVLPITGSIKK